MRRGPTISWRCWRVRTRGESGTHLLETVYADLLLTGTAYLEAVGLDGRVAALQALRPGRMRMLPGPDGWPAAYLYTAGGRSRRFDLPVLGAAEMSPILALALFHPDDDTGGLAPIEAAATALDIHNAASAWNKALLDNAAWPSGALVFAGATLSEPQFDRLKAELEANYQGAANAGRPLLLEGGLDWKQLWTMDLIGKLRLRCQMTEAEKKPKAYSYLRFSTADQAKGDSFRRQTALAEDYARRNGLDLDTELTFEDRGISAFSGRNKRKGALRTFFGLVDEGIIPEGSYLLVESLDRISREAILEAQGTFLMIINAGITLVTLKGSPRVYSRETVTANPTDLLISLIELIRAREESETKSGRIKADWLKKRERAAQGEAITSQVPAWLRRDGKKLLVVPERADVVRRIFDLTLRGEGQHAITSILSKEGVPTFGGGRLWHRSYVKRVLENPAVIGTFTPHKMVNGHREPMEPIRDYFPAIISPETFEAVRALDRPVGKAPPTATASIFSGLTKCEECGGPMIRARKGNASRGLYYVFVCQGSKLGQGCESRSVRQKMLEETFDREHRPLRHGSPVSR